MRFGGWPGGLRGALGGKTRGVKNANDERKLMFGDFFFNFWPQLVFRRPNEDKEMKVRRVLRTNGPGSDILSRSVLHGVVFVLVLFFVFPVLLPPAPQAPGYGTGGASRRPSGGASGRA